MNGLDGTASGPAPVPPVLRWIRRVLVTAGALVMGYAIDGLVTGKDTNPEPQFGFLAAGLAGHDLVALPIAVGVGALLGRYVPAPVRGAVRVGLYLSVVLTVIALPFVLGRGRRPDDPSALPLNYTHGLLIVLGVSWVGVAAAALLGWLVGRAPRSGARRPD